MKLNKRQQRMLSNNGFAEADFAQIERATYKRYTQYGAKKQVGRQHALARLTREQVIRMLGVDEYIAGISRSAFHATAAKQTPSGWTIIFNTDWNRLVRHKKKAV